VTGVRWRKVFRDIASHPGRSLLAVLAMAAGVFEIGAMLYKFALLQPELTTMHGRTRPASATLLTDAADDSVVAWVRRVPGVAVAEARPVVVARAKIGPDEWMPIVFQVVRDFDRQELDLFRPERGSWPPARDQILLERSALQIPGMEKVDSLIVRLPGGVDRALAVAGTVYAPGLAPAWMEHMLPGFVAWNSSVRGEEYGESAQVRIVVADHPLDEGYIREVADSVKARLVSRGVAVSRVTVPVPGRHPHADQMEAFLFLLLAFGILSFLLSTVLVAGMIHALMAEQVKQVGMMKAIGATSRQVAGIYLAQVGVLSAAALAIGIPAGLVVGRAYAEFAAGILNADLSHRTFPLWLLFAEIAVGLVVPMLVAMGPVRRAAGITVREALSDEGTGNPFGERRAERWLMGLAALPRPLALSLRTTFQRRGRLVLTVATLAVGGAVFVSALNVAAAWTRSVERDFERRRYDLTVSLAAAQPVAEIDRVLAGVPRVERAEYWPGASPYLIGPDGVPGSTLALVGPDPGSKLLDLPLHSGRWLRPEDSTAVVINRAVLTRYPGLTVGDTVRVRFEGRTAAFPIAGIVKEMAPMPVIYAARSAVLALTRRSGEESRTIRLVTRGHSDADQRAAAAEVERAFAAAGIEVLGLQRMEDVKKSILDHLVIILAVLTMASVIVVIVGGLGLASTLMLNVVQRTREIGVLGAIGAGPRTIAANVWFESLILGVLSWGVSMVLAVPASWLLESVTGNIFFKAPLDFYFSPGAAGLWLAVVLVLASLSSAYPARRAARLPVREALAHA
jgi:putative ABC transport system permease protein